MKNIVSASRLSHYMLCSEWWLNSPLLKSSPLFLILILILIPLLFIFIFRKQKGEKITIWERNFQLAFYSILLLCSVLFYESAYTESDPGSMLFFNGWTINTVLIALIQAVRTSNAHELTIFTNWYITSFLTLCSCAYFTAFSI